MRVIPGAEEFYFEGGSVGCLLVHGFTGSPAEMRLLGERLAGAGYTVYGVRLAGHGTCPEDMLRTDHNQWYKSVEHGWETLSRNCAKIFVIGLSMGGTLALHLAGNYPVQGVVALSTPIYINNRKLPFLLIFRLFRTFETKQRKAMAVDPRYNISYDRTPLRCVTSLLKLIKLSMGRLQRISAPVLIIQSTVEHTVKPESAEYIFRNLTGTQEKELVWLHESGHVITLDKERETVFSKVLEFVRKYS